MAPQRRVRHHDPGEERERQDRNGTNMSNQRRTMPTIGDELRVLWIAAITFPPNNCSS